MGGRRETDGRCSSKATGERRSEGIAREPGRGDDGVEERWPEGLAPPSGMRALEASRQHARLSRKYMREAILDLLAVAPHHGLLLREITDVLELPHPGESVPFDATALGHLGELRKSGRVAQPGGKGTAWKLTPDERARKAAR